MKYDIIFFFIVLFAVSCSGNQAAENKPSETKVPVQYSLATVKKAGVPASVKLPAQLAAYEEVSIFPKINGYVKNVLVDIGSRVSKGRLLMMLEAPEIEQAVLQAKEKYARSRADFSIDKEHYQRFLEASATAGAISPLDLSTLKAKMEADSAFANAEKLNWQMQETMLGYLQVVAPFNGIITERNVHPGALVSAAVKDKPMLELKQIEQLRLEVDVPEAFAGTLKDKDTVSFYVSSLQGKKMVGTISRQSMNINARYRSERMEIDVDNKAGRLAAGMYADVVLYSKGNKDALSVPRSAVVTSTERKYVLVVRDGKAIKADVSTGNATPSSIEIFGQLQEGDRVIENASDQIEEGIAVK
ncbi:MAG: efflux RND transporter periplasmic adaptor subunit [Bacteroidota bacterium]